MEINKQSKKALKEVLTNEVKPLMLGLRNEMKETNKNLVSLLAKEIARNELSLVMNGKEVVALKGNDGKTPKKGEDYFTASEQAEFIVKCTPVKGVHFMTPAEVQAMVKQATPIKGKHYFTVDEIKTVITKATPIKGKHYFTKTEIKEFLKAITPKKGIDYKDGVDGVTKTITEFVEISATDIRDKLESLKGSSRLSIKAIKGLQEVLDGLGTSNRGSNMGMGGGGSGSSGVTSFVQLTDVPSSYVGQAGKGVRVNNTASGLEFYTTTSTDEKVKLNASDPTAGYLDDKITAYGFLTSLSPWTSNINGGGHDLSNVGNITATSFVKSGGTSSQFLKADGSVDSATYLTSISGLDHNSLGSLTVGDVHTQYALLAGRSGGQTLIGGTASGNNLTLKSTSNATKGKVIFGNAGTTVYDEVNERFGIGTNSPSTKLEIRDSTNLQMRLKNTIASTYRMDFGQRTDGSAYFYNYSDGGGAYASFDIAGSPLIFKNDSGEVMRIASNNNVGVGTSTPGAKLHSLATTEQLRLGYDSTNYTKFTVASSSALTIAPSVNGTSAFNFTNVAGTSVLNIDTTNGRVGIGTTSPSKKLHLISTSNLFRAGYDTSNYFNVDVSSTGEVTFDAVGSGASFTFSDKINNTLPQNLKGYTVATLPTGVVGDIAYVTDQLTTPVAKGVAPTGGGAVNCVVFYNGSAWVGI